MKTLLPRLAIVCTLTFLIGCFNDEPDSPVSIDTVLGENDYAVYRGVLTFRDHETFRKVINELQNKTETELAVWEEQLGFKSLRSIFEKAIREEEVFLSEKESEYSGNTSLTRKELGYTKLTTDFLNKGLFVVNEFETIDMNVTIPIYGAVVNQSGIVAIGKSIMMPQLYSIKTIKDGDHNKIGLLNNSSGRSTQHSAIEVSPVKRISFKSSSDNGRTKNWTYCDATSGSYRTIAYEEYVEQIMGGDPCRFIPASYYIQFRSLKKFLGTWQNHQTSQWYVISTVTTDHYKYCQNASPLGLATLEYLRNIVDLSGVRYDLDYGHTVYKYFFNLYDLGPCASGGLGTCADPYNTGHVDPQGQTYFTARSHDVYGKNGANCHVGE